MPRPRSVNRTETSMVRLLDEPSRVLPSMAVFCPILIAPNNTEHRDTGTVFTCTGTFGGVRPMRQCRHTGNKKEVTFVSRRSLTASRLRVPSSFYLSYWYCYSSRVPPYRSPYTELINNKQHTACQANTADFIRMIATANSGPPTYSELTHLYVDFSTGLL